MAYTDTTIMPFGKHKGNQLEKIPDSWYLSFWYRNQDWYKEQKAASQIVNGGRQFGKTYDLQRYNVLAYIDDNFPSSAL